MLTCVHFHNYKFRFVASEDNTMNKGYSPFNLYTDALYVYKIKLLCLEPILNSSVIKYVGACLMKTSGQGFLSNCYFCILH
jgi:hypothetical protein